MSIARAALVAEAEQILEHKMFLHIPKTGGTSVEEELQERGLLANAVRWQVEECCNFGPEESDQSCCWPGPPWHLAPDVFEGFFHRSVEGDESVRRPRWCVIRQPAARYVSCVA